MRPARALFFKRGGLDSKLNSWARMLFKAVLGEHIAPFRVRSHQQPVCFERAVVTRRYRPAPHERSIVLQEVQERAWAYCRCAVVSCALPPTPPIPLLVYSSLTPGSQLGAPPSALAAESPLRGIVLCHGLLFL